MKNFYFSNYKSKNNLPHQHEIGSSKEEREQTGVRAVERAADILISLGKAERSLADLSREVGLNKATVLRILASLERKGFVLKDKHTGKYAIDVGLWGLFSGALYRRQGLVKIALPFMKDLWEQTGETITLYIRKGSDRVCIAELPSVQPLRYTAGLGQTVPLYAGSPGKLILAYLPPEELNAILEEKELLPLTKKTITNKNVLLAELEQIRKQGWSTSFGERIEGVSSLSVPIFDGKGEILASLNILGPYVRLGEDRLMGFLGILQAAAENISYAAPANTF